MNLKDKYGNDIKLNDELNVPLDVFSNGIVVKDKDGDLCLELRYEHKKIKLKKMSENFFNKLELL